MASAVADQHQLEDKGRFGQAFASIYQLTISYASGELERRVSLSDLDRQRIDRDICSLRDYLIAERSEAWNETMATIVSCVSQARYYAEILNPRCEGAVLSVMFYLESDYDDQLLTLFKQYTQMEVETAQKQALGNLFYPRYQGICWFCGRTQPDRWHNLVVGLQEMQGIFTELQLRLVLIHIDSPPTSVRRDTRSFPLPVIGRSLAALALGQDTEKGARLNCSCTKIKNSPN